ncbi:hypothetical protein EAE96_010997 [Botrytis aclada]|nr:hypothetical protein EAE96_010997 [Botrytis aclada]
MLSNDQPPPPPPPPYTLTPSPPSSPVTQTEATSAELTELLLLRTQMRELLNPIADHSLQLTQQTEQIALLEMKNQQLQMQMVMFWKEFDRRREEGNAAAEGGIAMLEEFTRMLKLALVVAVAGLVYYFLLLLLKMGGVEGI